MRSWKSPSHPDKKHRVCIVSIGYAQGVAFRPFQSLPRCFFLTTK
jgi:hypothetical protein